jgi:hypothetical protein
VGIDPFIKEYSNCFFIQLQENESLRSSNAKIHFQPILLRRRFYEVLKPIFSDQYTDAMTDYTLLCNYTLNGAECDAGQ